MVLLSAVLVLAAPKPFSSESFSHEDFGGFSGEDLFDRRRGEWIICEIGGC